MSYQAQIENLSREAVKLVERLWGAVEMGRLPPDQFIRIVADFTAACRIRGAAAAQVAFRGVVEAAVATPVAVTASDDVAHVERLQSALGTILADATLDTLMQLKRLVGNEPLQAAAEAMSAELAASELVSGWRRGLDSDPCQLCLWWWREGRVWRPDHRMPRHPGCACLQVPVVERTTNYQTEDQAKASRRQ